MLAHTDGGVDGFIEIRRIETNELTNLIFQVQSKATAKEWSSETADSFEFRCSEKDINYWLQGNTPVVLIVSRPDTNEAYWVSVKDYFKDLAVRKTKKIRFDKKVNLFDVSATSALLALAAPIDSGLYSEPPPIIESLISNLVPVMRYPPHLYVASTDYRNPAMLNQELRELEVHPGHEWFLKEGKIFTFHDLTRFPWHTCVDRGTIEIFGASEWANADDAERRRDFVRLLNQSLRRFFGARSIWRFALKETAPIYFFAPGRDQTER